MNTFTFFENLIIGVFALIGIQITGILLFLWIIGYWDTEKPNAYKPTVDNTTTPPADSEVDPLRILREDTYTNDDINRMVGEMERRQYAENNK